jgi:hypothetical protein
MRDTLFATFVTAQEAGKALGRLLAHGVNKQDFSVILCESRRVEFDAERMMAVADQRTSPFRERYPSRPMTGLSDRSPGDDLATLVAPTVPGFGVILGDGNLARALAHMAASDALPSRTSWGCLVDQGVPRESALFFHQTIQEGGALASISVPSGNLSEFDIRTILAHHCPLTVETFHVIANMSTWVPRGPRLLT